MALHPDIERAALVGFHIYPASRSLRRAACFKGATDQATCDLEKLEEWQHTYRGCGWRMVFGPSSCWGLDIDAAGDGHEADGIAAFARLVAQNDPLPARPMSRSGGGGYGLFFKHSGEPISGKSGHPAPGIDPRRGRLSIAIPPTIHHRTSAPYRWLTAPWDIAPPKAPGWLLSAVAPPPEPEFNRNLEVTTDTRARRALHRAIDDIQSAPSGTANVTLNRKAFAVARHCAAGVLSESEAVEALYAAARARSVPHLEAKDTIRSAFRGGYRRPLEAAWSGR